MKRAYVRAVAGRLSRVRRTAFVVALLACAVLYAYSLAGIVNAGGDIRPTPIAKTVERYHGCPAERDDAVRL